MLTQEDRDWFQEQMRLIDNPRYYFPTKEVEERWHRICRELISERDCKIDAGAPLTIPLCG